MTAIRKLPDQSERVETGPVQFGEDWPGVFLRGDNAFAYNMSLRQVLRGTADPFTLAMLQGLVDTLAASDLTGLSKAAAEPGSCPAPALPSDEKLDELAAAHWHSARYSGRDGQEFDHRAFARECLRLAALSPG